MTATCLTNWWLSLAQLSCNLLSCKLIFAIALLLLKYKMSQFFKNWAKIPKTGPFPHLAQNFSSTGSSEDSTIGLTISEQFLAFLQSIMQFKYFQSQLFRVCRWCSSQVCVCILLLVAIPSAPCHISKYAYILGMDVTKTSQEDRGIEVSRSPNIPY